MPKRRSVRVGFKHSPEARLDRLRQRSLNQAHASYPNTIRRLGKIMRIGKRYKLGAVVQVVAHLRSIIIGEWRPIAVRRTHCRFLLIRAYFLKPDRVLDRLQRWERAGERFRAPGVVELVRAVRADIAQYQHTATTGPA